jgi:hypothetical protein
VNVAVVDPLRPQVQRFLHLCQVRHVVPDRVVLLAMDLDQELPPHGLKHTFDLASAFGLAGGGVGDPDAQPGAGA